MSKRDKLLARLKDAAEAKNLSFDELKQLLSQYGFTARKGNDWSFTLADPYVRLVIAEPHGGDKRMKWPYISRIRDAFQLLGLFNDDEKDEGEQE